MTKLNRMEPSDMNTPSVAEKKDDAVVAVSGAAMWLKHCSGHVPNLKSVEAREWYEWVRHLNELGNCDSHIPYDAAARGATDPEDNGFDQFRTFDDRPAVDAEVIRLCNRVSMNIIPPVDFYQRLILLDIFDPRALGPEYSGKLVGYASDNDEEVEMEEKE